MDREPAGATDAHPRPAVARGPRRGRAAVLAVMAAVLAVMLVLVAVLAVLAIRPAALGGDADVRAPVVAIGIPLGPTDSVSVGVVSGLNRTAQTAEGTYSGLIQFDASVNPGSSGGPLLDAGGVVVGIVLSIANPDHQDAFAGIGFAVPLGSAPRGRGGPGPR